MHHVAIRDWFARSRGRAWATCPITEAGFVRIASNRKIIGPPVSVEGARGVLGGLRAATGHRFVVNDVSMTDADVPALAGHRQVTDALLLTVARRHGVRLVTFDAGLADLADGDDVELLRT